MSLRTDFAALLFCTMFAALFEGCSAPDLEPTSDGGGAGGGASASSASSSATVTSSATGMTPSDVDGTIDTATEIGLNEVIEGDLEETGDVDFYKFDGTAGQVIYIYVRAQDLANVKFHPDYIDTVVTLFGADKKQIAENNNRAPVPTKDSMLTRDKPFIV